MERSPIAITGIGVICAAGSDVPALLDSLLGGRTGIRRLSAPQFAIFPDAIGGEVDDALERRLELLGFPSARDLARPSKLALVAAAEALARSGLDLDALDRNRIGVAMGKCQTEGDEGRKLAPVHTPTDVVATAFGLRGPRLMVSTACAASTNAIGIARDKLWNGEAEVMLAGGTDALSAATYGGFRAMQALSDEPCAPYGVSKGLNLGEGAAFLVLEPVEAAERRGATILAEVVGYGLSADAYHATAPDPTGRGATAAVRRALADAGVDADEVSYVNGHGTGTPANDRMERKVMRTVFGDRHVPVSSTKSFVGHTLGAAGAVEAVTCVAAIEHGFVPPTLHVPDVPDGDIDYVPNVARREPVDVVVSNNYAFGGNNASIVLAKPGRIRNRRLPHAPSGVVITGLGLVGSLGVGVDEWRQSLRRERPSLRPATELFDTDGDVPVAAMPSLDGGRWASPADWRHMDAVTRQALVATKLAIGDADLPLGRNERSQTGLIMGTAFGPAAVGLTISQQSARTISPVTFSQVTLNAPAGKVCQVLGLRGPTTTITSGAVSGSIALACAVDLIRYGATDTCVVVATDELFLRWIDAARDRGMISESGQPRPYHPERDGEVLGAGAVALVLEAAERADERGARGYARVASVRHGGGPRSDDLKLDPTGERWAAVIDNALTAGGVEPGDVDHVVGWASGNSQDDVEVEAMRQVLAPDVAVAAPKALTGNCMAASGLVNVAVAALSIAEGEPAQPSRALAELVEPADVAARRSVRAAAALDADLGSNYAAALLTDGGAR